MAFEHRIRIAGGVGAIWKGPNDTLPFDDPFNHLDRVKFHSALRYTRIIQEIQLTLTLKPRAGIKDVSDDYILFPHGKGGPPLIQGALYINGAWCAFNGSIPVQLETPNHNPQQFARWISLCVDSTNVSVHEYCVAYWSNAQFYNSYPQISVPIVVWITNEMLPS